MGITRSVTRSLTRSVCRSVAAGGGGPSVWVPPTGSMTFNGSSDYVDTGITMDGWTAFSWVRGATYLSTSGSDVDGLHLGSTKWSMGRISTGALALAMSNTIDNSVATTVANDVAHSLSLRWQSGQAPVLALDGTQVNSIISVSATISNALYPIYVGARNNLGTADSHSHYTATYWLIYDRAITDDEEDYIRTGGASGDNPGPPVWSLF